MSGGLGSYFPGVSKYFGSGTELTGIKTSAYTASAKQIVRVDPTAGAMPVTLPSAVGLAPDDMITIKVVANSANAITIGVEDGGDIDNAASYGIAQAYGTATFVPDGANWMAFPPAE